MKTKITFLFALLLVGFAGFAQQDEECMTKLSIFHEYVKAKNYEAAFQPWKAVREKCPDFNFAIYADGEEILEDKIKKTEGAEKAAHINDLLKLWEQRAQYFPAKTPKGEYAAKGCQLQYDNYELLNKTAEELYACFDAAYKLDKDTFTNPKSLYAYFSLMVDLYDAKKKTDAELFDKYDDVAEKVESEVENYSQKLNPLIEKEEAAGAPLTGKDAQYKKFYESYLGAYDQVAGAMDKKLGDRANCENLIPLYEKDFEANKTNETWIRRAVAKMYEKDCTDSPLFVKLVHAQHELKPSASSAYYLGVLKDKEGKSSEAVKFYQEAINLETDNYKKSKLYYRVGDKFKKSGSFGQARNYFREALKLNPSNGRPYLAIAAMYAASANSCGDTAFNKRAVYWLAAQEAAKAGNVDATLKRAAAQSVASYNAKAPQKSEIFSSGSAGKVINIGCWINGSVTVPSI